MNKTAGFSISSFMQQQMCFMGQSLVFKEASDSFLRLTGVAVSASQIERICHHYGQLIEQATQTKIGNGGQNKSVSVQGTHYVMVDGSMLLTREEKWKEIKLGRIFKSDDLVAITAKRKEITTSTYVAHLGNHTAFFEKLGYYTDVIPNKVFISDGAKWIWNWVKAHYPDSTQILDFYHAKEHLCAYAQHCVLQEQERTNFINEAGELLLNDGVAEIIERVKKRKANTSKQKQQKKILLAYYKQHAHRMMYKTFKQQGLLIGSGAIEAAHRHVLQQRLKLSGQRWTATGLQQVANLRVAFRSNQWETVQNFTKLAA